MDALVSAERYEANLRNVLEAAKAMTGHMALLASAPVLEGQPNPNAKTRLNADIREYNAVLARLAEEYGAQLIDLYAAVDSAGSDRLLNDDGIHPNADGHIVIQQLVQPYLTQLIDKER